MFGSFVSLIIVVSAFSASCGWLRNKRDCASPNTFRRCNDLQRRGTDTPGSSVDLSTSCSLVLVLALVDLLLLIITRGKCPQTWNWPNLGESISVVAVLLCFSYSEGQTVDNPRFYRKAEKKLKRLHRQLSRKQKKSQKRQGSAT